MAKIRIEDIQDVVDGEGWKLLSTEYTNLDTEMTFECPEGHKVYAPWKKLRTRRECPTCKATMFGKPEGEIVPKKKGTKRTLALDQATHTTGWAIFDDAELVSYGAYNAAAGDDIERFAAVKVWLLSMINNWQPDFIGIEGIQFQEEGNGQKMGVTVFQTLARLQGILMLTCYEAKIPYEICPTNTWRHECGVKGRSRTDRKRSMQMLVKQWYGISISDDESDAIGIGHYMVGRRQRNSTVTNWET